MRQNKCGRRCADREACNDAMPVKSSPRNDSEYQPKTRFEVGEAVEARYKKGSQWYAATIAAADRAEDTYDLEFDDGDTDRLHAHYIRPRVEASVAYSVGERVEGRFGGREKWYSAVVSRIGKQGTVDLDYDDGDKETCVPVHLVRNLFEAGEAVAARFGGGNNFNPGHIAERRSDGSYDVEYDDGTRETRVDASLIRRASRAKAVDKVRRRREVEDEDDEEDIQLRQEAEGLSILPSEARAEFQQWARRNKGALQRLINKGSSRLDDCLETLEEKSLPRRLRRYAARITDCIASAMPNTKEVLWCELVDFFVYAPETSRVAAARLCLGTELSSRERNKLVEDLKRRRSSGAVGTEEARAALLDAGGKRRGQLISERDADAICLRLADEDDNVNIDALRRWLHGGVDRPTTSVEDLAKKGRRKIGFWLRDERPSRLRRLLDRYDKGSCSSETLRSVLCLNLSLPLIPAEVDALATVHRSSDGRVDYEALLADDSTSGGHHLDSDEGEDRANSSRLSRGLFRRASRDRSESREIVRTSDDDYDGGARMPALLSRRGVDALRGAVAATRRQSGTVTSVFEKAAGGSAYISPRQLRQCLFSSSRQALGATDVPEADQEKLLLVLFAEHKRTRITWAEVVDFLEEIERVRALQRDDDDYILADAYTKLRYGVRRDLPRFVSILQERDTKRLGSVKLDDFLAALKRCFQSLTRAEREALGRNFKISTDNRVTSRFSLSAGIRVGYAAFERWLTADPAAADYKLATGLKLLGKIDRGGLHHALEILNQAKKSGARQAAFVRMIRNAYLPLCDGELWAVCARERSLERNRLDRLVEEGHAAIEGDDLRDDIDQVNDSDSRASLADSEDALVPAKTKRRLWEWIERHPLEARREIQRAEHQRTGRLSRSSLCALLEDLHVLSSNDECKWLDALDDGDGVSIEDFLAFARTPLEKPNPRFFEAMESVQRRLAEKGINRAKLTLDFAKRHKAAKRLDSATVVIKVIDGHVGISSAERRAMSEEFANCVDMKAAAARLCVNFSSSTRVVRQSLHAAGQRPDDVSLIFQRARDSTSLTDLRVALVHRLGMPVCDADVCALFDACSPKDGHIFRDDLRDVLADTRRTTQNDSSDLDDDMDHHDMSDGKLQEADSELAVVSRELRLVLRALARKPGGLCALFDQQEDDDDVELSARDLRRILKRAPEMDRVDDADLESLVACLDVDGDGRINLEDLSSFTKPPETRKLMSLRQKIRQQLLAGQRIKPVLATTHWLRRSRSPIKQRAGSRSPIDVVAAMAAIDKKGDGLVDVALFRSALGKPPLNLKLELGEASYIARYFAEPGEGRTRWVDYISFARWLGSDAAGHTAWEYGAGNRRLSASKLRQHLKLHHKASKEEIQKAAASTAARRAERKLGVALELAAEVVAKKKGGKRLSAKALRQRFFAQLDCDTGEWLTRLELRQCLGRMGIPFSIDEVNALLDKLDTKGDGRISYNEANNMLVNAAKSLLEGSPGRHRDVSANSHDEMHDLASVSVAGVARRVRQAIRGENSSTGWPAEVAAAFGEMNHDANGLVDGKDLASWLCSRLRIKLTASERTALLDCLDVDGDGRVSYEELADFVLEEPAGDELGLIAGRLRDALGVKGCMALRAELKNLDRGSTGVANEHDVWRIVSDVAEKKLRLSTDDEAEVSRRFATSTSQLCYLNLCAWLEAGLGDAVLRRLRRKLRLLKSRRGSQRINAQRVFRGALKPGSRSLSREGFGKACDKCGIFLSGPALDAIVRRFDVDGDGRVDWGEFRKALFAEDVTESGAELPRVTGKTADDERATCIEALFAAFDTNGDGRLSRNEARNAASHVLRACGLRPTSADLEAIYDDLRHAAGDSKTIDYADFEATAMRHINEKSAESAVSLAELRDRLEAVDVRRDGRISRADFETACTKYFRLAKDEISALAVTCTAYSPQSHDEDVDDDKEIEPEVDIEEVMRLARAAATSGLETALLEAQAAPWRQAFDNAALDRGSDVAKIAASAALRISRGAVPDPAAYLLAFLPGLLPNSFREPALAVLEADPNRSLAATIAPEAVIATAAASSTSPVHTRLKVSLCEAKAVPSPRGAAHAERLVRCCLANCTSGNTSPAGNVHVARAALDPERPDCWVFAQYSPPRTTEPRQGGDDWHRRISAGIDNVNLVVVADERKSGTLALLFELTLRLQKKFFYKANRLSHESAQKTSSSDDSDEAPSDYRLSDSEEDGDHRSPRKRGLRRRGRRRRIRDDKSEDDGQSDDDEFDDYESKRPVQAGRHSRPIWHKRKLASSRSAPSQPTRPRDYGQHDDIDDDAQQEADGLIEVSCGWTLVRLDQLRDRIGPITLELKGGSPFAEEPIERTDIPWRHRGPYRRLAQAVLGYSLKSRLRIRVAPLAADHSLQSNAAHIACAAIIPEPFAILASTYAAYLEMALAAHLGSNQAATLADPVLAVFRRLVAVEPFRVALRALWSFRFDEAWRDQNKHKCLSPGKFLTHTTKNVTSKRELELIALRRAVLELWPFCGSSSAHFADYDTTQLKRPEMASSSIYRQALHLVGTVISNSEPHLFNRAGKFDAVHDDQSARFSAPFHTRELVLI